MRLPVTLLAASLMLSGCMVAQGYTEQEQSIVDSLDSGLYQPASRSARDSISTQSVLAQATFWSREAQLNPADLESAVRLTSAVRKMGNSSQAVDIAQMARSMHPTDPYLLAEYAASLIAAERGSEAKKPLQQGLRTTPAYGRLWSLMGAALDQEEKYTEARRHYERALQITPNDPNVLANMGLSFALEGNAPVAETWLRRAAAQPEAGAGVEQNLALVLQLQGKPAEGQLAQRQSRPSPTQSRAGQARTGQPSTSQHAQHPTWNRTRVQGPVSQTLPRTQPRIQAGSQIGARPQNTPQLAGQASRPYQQTGQVSSGQLSNGQNFSVGKGAPRSAMEAARMAAQNSQGRRTVVGADQAVPQSSFLGQGQQAQRQVQGQIQGQIQGQYQGQVQAAPPQGYAQPQAPLYGAAQVPAVRGRARGR